MIQLLSGIDSTASALDAERIRMDVISENIANINTTKGLDGKPYQRQEVVFESVLSAQQSGDHGGAGPQTTHVARVVTDNRPARLVYNPTHPDADAQGMVAMPDINIHEEMVDMIASSRAYEANIAVVRNARMMAQEDLSISKHS
jgi:flagellar basal-body rod protein FlgC